MISDIKKLVKHTSIYGIGTILGKIAGFLMIPVYTHYLTPEDYGILEILDLTITVAGIFVGMGISGAIFRFYYQKENDEQRKLISTAFVFVLIIASSVVGLLIINSSLCSELIFKTSEYKIYFVFMFISFYFSSIASVPEAYCMAKQKSSIFTTVSLTTLFVNLLLNIYVIVFLQQGVLGLVAVSALVRTLNAIFWIVYTLPKTGIGWSKKILIEMLSYSLPLIPASLGVFIISFSDRFFLSHFMALSSVGLYSLGHKFGFMINLLILQPFNRIWQAQVFEIAEKKDAKVVIGRLFTYFSGVVIFCVLGLSVMIKDIIEIISDHSYLNAYKVVPLIALAGFFRGAYYFFQSGLLIEKKTKFVSYSIGITLLFNVVFNYVFILYFDFIGAGISSCLTNFIMALSVFLFSRKFFDIKFEFIRILHLIFVAFSLWVLSTQLPFENIMISIGLKFCLILSYPALLYLSGFLKKEEKDYAVNYIAKIFKNSVPHRCKSDRASEARRQV